MIASKLLLESQGSFKAVALGEDAVAVAWERQLLAGELRTGSGEKLQIIHRGRRSAEAGPDFRDAIVALEGGRLLRGDVEIHVRASDWRNHGHSNDRRYDGVVLHVVMWDDVGSPTPLFSGAVAPVLALRPFLTVPLDVLRENARQQILWVEPCGRFLEEAGQETTQRLLERVGGMRLASKAAAFEAAIACKGYEQALYEGVMEALGYAKNRGPFRDLAEQLPLASLQGLLHNRQPADAILRLQGIMLGTAGLLPSQRRRPLDSDYAVVSFDALEEAWRGYGGDRFLEEGQWDFFRIRPENFPTRRIAGAAEIIFRSLDAGLVEYLLRPFVQPTPRALRSALVGVFVVGARKGFKGQRGFSEQRVIGQGRAKVMVVNVVIPFAMAFGKHRSQPELVDRARWAYLTFPRLPSDSVVRLMTRQLFGVPTHASINSAARQQGLHYIYIEFCRWHRCGDCPVKGN